MPYDLDVLAEFSLDAWLLAGGNEHRTEILPDGRIWEQTVGNLLRRPGLTNHQGPGTTTLFGFRPASGIGHELDAGAAGRGGCIILECKSKSCGVSKEDVALFHAKTLDFYNERPETVAHEHWWRVIVSSSPISIAVRAFCIQLGLIVCDPTLLPLPVIMRTVCRSSADQYLRETLLQEVVRLGEPALMSMQKRWTYDPIARDIRFKPKVMSANEVRDLFWLQDELGSDIIDLYDLHRPGTLERRAALLHTNLRKSA